MRFIKRFLILPALAGALQFSALSFAETHDMSQHAAMSAQVYHAEGVVTKVTPHAIYLSHTAVPALNWPAMTMPFALPADASFPQVKPGDKVSFDFIQGANDYPIVSLTPQR
nr:copper-binding protein [uncultured Enterobacter sp.]